MRPLHRKLEHLFGGVGSCNAILVSSISQKASHDQH